MSTTVKLRPGRARLSIKIRTHEMALDLTGCGMSDRAAMLIYKVALSGKSDRESVLEMVAKLDAEYPAHATTGSGT